MISELEWMKREHRAMEALIKVLEKREKENRLSVSDWINQQVNCAACGHLVDSESNWMRDGIGDIYHSSCYVRWSR